jgi:hypothetical protein
MKLFVALVMVLVFAGCVTHKAVWVDDYTYRDSQGHTYSFLTPFGRDAHYPKNPFLGKMK